MSNVIDFLEAHNRKHSTRDLLIPAITQDYSEVEKAEVTVEGLWDEIIRRCEELEE